MNTAVRPLPAIGAWSAALGRATCFAFASWRQISARQFLTATAIALAMTLWFELTWWREFLAAQSWEPHFWILVNVPLVWAMLLLVVIVDRIEPGRWPWWAPYVAALAAVVLLNVLTSLLFEYVIPIRSLMEFTMRPDRAHPQRLMIEVVDRSVSAGFGVLIYAWLRRLRLQQALLHTLQQRQADARRRLTEARLQAMRARVEPQFLFDALARVEWLHGIEQQRALHALDALIAYLRAVMPRMPATDTTLHDELVLVRAWLEVTRLTQGSASILEERIAEGLGNARLPAMILHPLVQHQVALGCTGETPAQTLRLHASATQGRLVVSVTGCAIPVARRTADNRIESLRLRLATFYGDRAQLSLRHEEREGLNHVEATLDIPYEHADRVDRRG